ncbi:MAG: alpha/beta hydrolase [Dehalococcoidia bacterium]|nr:alpha/beta hydrolase [Dehalococcoidia bacterium]
MQWTSDTPIEGGLRERRFDADHGAGSVTGVLWTRAGATGRTPLVLVGHGGGSNKLGPNVIEARDAYAAHGVAVAAIDGPLHGDRGPVTDSTQPEYAAMWKRPSFGDGAIVDGMVADWRASLDGLLATGEFLDGAVGYHGLSMGTMFGLPFVVAEPRVVAASLGLCGTGGSSIDRSGIGPRLTADAAKLRVPVLFHFQWDDERFSRAGSLEMFDRFPTNDKRLQSTPGMHADTSPEAKAALVRFLAERLALVHA